jgi:hypothetical protein
VARSRLPAVAPASVEGVGLEPGTLTSLLPALEQVDAWAGGAEALIVGGSHASGEAVWIEEDGRRRSLSDLDVYAIVPDRARQRAALARSRDDLASRHAPDLLGPIEPAFLTAADLEQLPARPGTIELRRHGVVVRGDARWRERVPEWSGRDVSAEEILLLLENRAFELLDGWNARAATSPPERLHARHERLKCALDLATVAVLERGEYPDGSRARVTLARARMDGADLETVALWERALAWREGRVEPLAEDAALAEWRAVVAAWRRSWWRVTGVGNAPSDPLARARACAARAPRRRQARQALLGASGRGPGLVNRLRHAARGIPQHRLNGSAVVLLLAAESGSPGRTEPGLDPATCHALVELGVVPASALGSWSSAARAAVATWDQWILAGRRGARREP